MIKITGLKRAVGDYQRANSYYFGRRMYGILYCDRKTGELWTNVYASPNSWTQYNDPAIVNLVRWAHEEGVDDGYPIIVMLTVKKWAEAACREWRENG